MDRRHEEHAPWVARHEDTSPGSKGESRHDEVAMELSEIHSPLTTNGSTFASFARSSSESDFETLRSQLTSAKRAGQRNRRRISGTTGVLAIILLVAVVALLFVAGATGRSLSPRGLFL